MPALLAMYRRRERVGDTCVNGYVNCSYEALRRHEDGKLILKCKRCGKTIEFEYTHEYMQEL